MTPVEARKNITLLILYSSFLKRFAFPVITLYYLMNQLSFTQIGILAMVTSVSSMVLEIPAGLFADRFGKRASLLVASFFAVIYSLLLALGSGFWLFFVAVLFFGSYFAFSSGTREAMLFDFVAAYSSKADYKKYLGKMRLYNGLFSAITLITASILFKIEAKLPFWIMAGFMFASFALAFLMKEPPLAKDETDTIPLFTFHGSFKTAFFQMFQDRYVFAGLILMVVVTAFFRILADYGQPLIQLSGVDVLYFGVIYAVIRVVQGVASEVTHRLDKVMKPLNLLFLALLLMIAGFFVMGQGRGFALVGALLLMNGGYWMLKTTIDDEINQAISSAYRATILSIVSFMENILAVVVVMSFSLSADWQGLQPSFIYATLALVVVGGLSLFNVYLTVSGTHD